MGKKLNLSGIEVKAARRLTMGKGKGHAKSAFNACVGAALKDQKYPTPDKGMGGRNNKQVRAAFTAAVRKCSGK